MKFVLAMLFPIVMTGTTISATVDCGSGAVGGAGASSASCSVPGSSMASASADFESVSSFGIDVIVGTSAGATMRPMASAIVDVDLLVDVTGSTGNALFVPCVEGSGDNELASAVATVSANGLSSSSDHNPIDNCGSGPPGFVNGPNAVFTFGQPFTMDLTLSGAASVASPFFGPEVIGHLALSGYEVVSVANQTPIPGAIISVTILPEPNAASMVMLMLALSLGVGRLRARCRVDVPDSSKQS